MLRSIFSRVAANKASESSADKAPLLSSITVAMSVDSDEHEPGPEGTIESNVAMPTAAQLFKSILVFLIAVAGAGVTITMFILLPTLILDLQMTITACIAGGVCLMNSIIVMYKEQKLLYPPCRRQAVERLRRMAETLKSEAVLLRNEAEQLSNLTYRFGDAEQELGEIAQGQGYSIEDIVELVHLNEDTMDMMRENLRQKVIEDVIGIIILCHKGINERIDRVEAKLLALKISVKLEQYGITFDEDKFTQAVALHPTLLGTIGTIRMLLPPNEDIDDDESIVSVRYDIYDMFYMTNAEPERRGSSLSSAAIGRSSLATRIDPSFENRLISGRKDSLRRF